MATEETDDQFQDTPEGWARRWAFEFDAAKKAHKGWQEDGKKVVARYLDERESAANGETRLNLFTANVQTQQATLYGNTPKVDVGRRFADADDDVARVGGEMLERILNSDIERASDTFAQALEYALEGRLLPGLGLVRVRYEFEEEEVPGQPAQVDELSGLEIAPEVPATVRRVNEDVPTDFVYWEDVLWGPARVWHEVPWIAFKALMSREALVKRFGEEEGKKIPLDSTEKDKDNQADSPWGRAAIWEIWHKETRRVFWFTESPSKVLDDKEDPLQLAGFWPCARPLIANATTTKFVPRADFYLAQDQYNQIDVLSTRISLLEDAIKVVGVYDKTNAELKALLTGKENKMIPVDNFALLQEKGGLRGTVDWFPLEQVVNALTSLRDVRAEKIDLLYQVTGMSDIMRGAAGAANVTATEQTIKAKFGSVRIQRLQDDFARFASETQSLKAEIIAKHFQPETIIARSNVMKTPDAPLAQQAVQLLQDDMQALYRVQVKSEAISLTDFAALKTEKMELLTAVGGFMQMAAPLAQQMGPKAAPLLMKLLQGFVAGLRGSSQVEAVLDQAVAQAEEAAKQPATPPPPDPKLLSQQMKGQQDLQKIQAELQADLVRTQAEVAGDAQREQDQATWNVREAMQKQQIGAASRAAHPGAQKPGGMP